MKCNDDMAIYKCVYESPRSYIISSQLIYDIFHCRYVNNARTLDCGRVRERENVVHHCFSEIFCIALLTFYVKVHQNKNERVLM